MGGKKCKGPKRLSLKKSKESTRHRKGTWQHLKAELSWCGNSRVAPAAQEVSRETTARHKASLRQKAVLLGFYRLLALIGERKTQKGPKQRNTLL